MAWIHLNVSPSAGAHLPPLLISACFSSASYAVQVTDLTHIWSEKLHRREIIQRSKKENTSIDPSDGDQFRIFMEKLEVGLARGNETALALTITADADRPTLVLNVSVKLPGGLAPLEWPIQLAAMPQSLLTSQFTVPLLMSQRRRMQEMASLTEVLRDKDHVIQKLMDKLESQGTELGQIFPQAAGKVGRKLERKRAEERVKGLGPFDMEAWKKMQDHETSRDVAALVGHLFTGDENPLDIGETVTSSEETDNWWNSIKGITVDLDSGRISTNGYSSLKESKTRPKSNVALRRKDTVDEDDAFQVQAKPTRHSTSPEHATSKSAVANDSTDDEDDLDTPSQRSKIPDSYPHSQPVSPPEPSKAKKLGTIGGKKTAPKTALPVDDSTDDESSPPKQVASRRRRTASPTASPAPEKTPAKFQKNLGTIGGKKAALVSEPSSEHEVSPSPAKASTAPEAPKSKKAKLGQIGGKKKQAGTPPPVVKNEDSLSNKNEEEERGRASVRVFEREKTPPPRETSEERADNKRQQLKRELEKKAKVPVKKKRKF